MKFTKYSELIAHMLLAEKHQLLLIQNTRTRLPGTQPPPPNTEVHFNNTSNDSRPSQGGRGNRGGYRGQGSYRGRGRRFQGGGKYQYNGSRNQAYGGRGRGRSRYNGNRNTWRRSNGSQQQQYKPNNQENKDKSNNPVTCYRCGKKGHVKRVCRAPAHLAELYKKSVTTNQYEAHGAFLEATEILPEVHIIQQSSPVMPLAAHNVCIVDSRTTHSIFKDNMYFKQITPSQWKVTTIIGQWQLEEGFGPAELILPRGTKIRISMTIYAPKATRNLLSFKDIRENNLHIHTGIDNNKEVLQIVAKTTQGAEVRETIQALSPGLYATKIVSFHTSLQPNSILELWHRRLGHPGTTMFYRIIKDTQGIPAVCTQNR
jgi:hypothetical protein